MEVDKRMIMLVGDRLKAEGREKNITVEALAELVGIALTVWDYTDNASNLRMMTKAILAILDYREGWPPAGTKTPPPRYISTIAGNLPTQEGVLNPIPDFSMSLYSFNDIPGTHNTDAILFDEIVK